MPTFSTSFTPPDPVTGLSTTVHIELSSIELAWDATALGIDFDHYRVQRSDDGGVAWHDIGTVAAEGTTEFTDYEAPLGILVRYRLTVWNTTGYESDPTDSSPTALDSSAWWIVVPGEAALTFEVQTVTGWSGSAPLQSEQYQPVGRSKKMVVTGELLGEEGSLEVNANRDDAGIVALLRQASLTAQAWMLVKSPFGEVFRSRLGTIARRRAVAGRQIVSIPFIEVG